MKCAYTVVRCTGLWLVLPPTQVILIGGGSRVPRVQEILTEYVGRELGKNMNTDESAAMGAVYKAADLSTGMWYDHRAPTPPPPSSSTSRDGR